MACLIDPRVPLLTRSVGVQLIWNTSTNIFATERLDVNHGLATGNSASGVPVSFSTSLWVVGHDTLTRSMKRPHHKFYNHVSSSVLLTKQNTTVIDTLKYSRGHNLSLVFSLAVRPREDIACVPNSYRWYDTTHQGATTYSVSPFVTP